MTDHSPLRLHLRIDVDRAPDPFLLRAAVEARLAGRPWAGPERVVADRVVAAVTETATETEAGGWH